MKGIWRAISVEGLNLERFIRQASDQSVSFRRLKRRGKRLTAQVEEDCLPALENLSEQGGWRMRVGRRHGSGRLLDMLGRRWLLAVSLVLILGMVSWATSLVWSIDIENAGVYLSDVRTYLAQEGIRAGLWKRQIDPSALRDVLEWRYPKVAWVECGWRGMALKITFFEGVPQGETLTHTGAADVVALRDGVIDSVVVLAGTALVEPGDVVRKGQVLIQGQERTSNEEIRSVAARGSVVARVWDGAAVRMSAMEQETMYTGRTEAVHTVVCPWFPLWQTPESSFDQQDVSVKEMPLGGLFFPLIIRMETRMEAQVVPRPRDLAQLKTEAGLAAMRKLRQNIGIHDDFVDKWVDYCMIEDEVLEAVGIGERLIDIGETLRYDTP